MSKEYVRFKWLKSKPLGQTTVAFELEDGAQVEIYVNLRRAGVALDFKNPDGTPHYNIDLTWNISVVPADKTFSIPKEKLKKRPQPVEETGRPYA